RLNDIRSRPITRDDVFHALKTASGGAVEEGSVGAGTGTIAFGYKGGIGTASRRVPGGYTVGVLVQTNFGGELTIAGVHLPSPTTPCRPCSSPPSRPPRRPSSTRCCAPPPSPATAVRSRRCRSSRPKSCCESTA